LSLEFVFLGLTKSLEGGLPELEELFSVLIIVPLVAGFPVLIAGSSVRGNRSLL